MLNSSIKKSLESHCEKNPDLYFYQNCLNNLEKYPEKIELIEEDAMLIESCRIELLSNPSNYHIYISNTKCEGSGCSYRKITLDEFAMGNLLKQLVAVNEYNTIVGLTKDLKLPELSFSKDGEMLILYVIISTESLDIKKNDQSECCVDQPKFSLHKFETIYEILGYLMGINCLQTLKYQRLDRIVDFMTGTNTEAKRVYQQMDVFLKFLKTHTWQERDRMIIMSGAVYQAIGLTYTPDIDILVVNSNKNAKEACRMCDRFVEFSRKQNSCVRKPSDQSCQLSKSDNSTHSYQSNSDQSNSDQSNSDQSNSDQSNSDQSNSDQSNSDQSNSDQSNSDNLNQSDQSDSSNNSNQSNSSNNSNKSNELNKSTINSVSIYLDPNVLADDGNWYTSDPTYDPHYKKMWLSKTLPNLSGCKDIYWLTANPECHMCIMGMKYITLQTNIVKNISRACASTLSDLIMIKHLNGYDVGKIYVPNMNVKQGKVIIYDEKYMRNLRNGIQKMCRVYYGAEISLEEIDSKVFRSCENPHQIYKGVYEPDPDTQIISQFHMDVKHQIFSKYCGKNVQNLLDIGSGKMVDLRIWKKFNINKIVGIEPSTDSIQNAHERIQKLEEERTQKGEKPIDVKVVNGFGDVDWFGDANNSQIYQPVTNNKYDMITFQYTIHYMLDKLDQVLANLRRCMNDGCLVIITCMDGNLINRKFNERNIYQNNHRNSTEYLVVRNNHNDPIFLISRFDQSTHPDQILMYLKGSYGVTNGSVERLINIDTLIKHFSKNNINLIGKKSFLDYYSANKQKMTNWQKEVSSHYVSLVFQYNEKKKW